MAAGITLTVYSILQEMDINRLIIENMEREIKLKNEDHKFLSKWHEDNKNGQQ